MSEPCTCSAEVAWEQPGAAVVLTIRPVLFCPLHQAARDLLAALERLLAGLWCLGETEVSIEFAEAVIEAKALVAKAKLPA